MKYAVITCIFGKGKEILRTPLVKDDIEYICVTDQKDLNSDVWKIIHDEMDNIKCIRDKMVYVKYNPFKYTDADRICIIDGTLEITNSLIPFFQQATEYDMLVKLHPERNCLMKELNEWIMKRNMPRSVMAKFKIMTNYNNIDINTSFLLESCIIMYTRNDKVKELCNEVMAYMKFLGNDKNLFLSNQCILTLLLMQEQLKIGFIDQKRFFKRYDHGTWRLHDR